jgi:hypothetical protein
MSFILAFPYSNTFDGDGRIRIHLIGELQWRLDKCFQERHLFCTVFYEDDGDITENSGDDHIA